MPVNINVKADIKEATRYLSRVQRKVVPVATAKALTFTAERVQKEQTRIIPQIFSNPTRTTRKAVYKTTATVAKPTVFVGIKDVRGENRWLEHHITGGARPKKGSERAGGRGRLGAWTAMGRDAKKNKFGNIPRATYAKMFADAQLANAFSGDYSSTKTKAAGGTKAINYFAGVTRKGRRAIYKKTGGKRNPKITPMLIEVSRPTYRKRWPFYRVGNKMARRVFPRLFNKQLDRELAKLR
jgi:hypothetical protein